MLGIVVIGLGAVWAAGMPLTGGWKWTALGLAPMTGIAVSGIVSVIAAATRLGVRIEVVVPASLVLIAVAAPFRTRFTTWSLRPSSGHPGWRLAEVSMLVVGAFVAVRALRAYFTTPLEAWDGWEIWGAHAHALFVEGDVFSPVFRDPAYASQHPDYPVLFPSLEALSADALGRFDPQLIHAVPAGFLVALGLAAWGILRTLIPPFLAAAAALFVMGSGQEIANLSDNYADGAVAGLAAIGVLLVGLWLVRDCGTALVLASILLAAAGLTKSEGAIFVDAAFLAALLVGALSGRRLRPLIASFIVAISAPVSWQVFAGLVIPPTASYDFSVLTDPRALGDRADRYPRAIRAMGDMLLLNWTAAVFVVLLALALAAIVVRWRLALYLVLWTSFSLGGLGIPYLVSTLDIDLHLVTSAARIVGTIAVGASLLAAWIAVDAWDHRPGRGSADAPDHAATRAT